MQKKSSQYSSVSFLSLNTFTPISKLFGLLTTSFGKVSYTLSCVGEGNLSVNVFIKFVKKLQLEA